MSTSNNLFAEGMPRGIGKMAWLAGVVMILVAVALYVRFVAANNSSMYEKVPAVIKTITTLPTDSTIRKMVYEYRAGPEVRTESTTYPAAEGKKFVVGGTIILLRDIETGEITYADSGPAIIDFSIKLGLFGLVVLIAAIVFLRRNPAPRQ
jgi:hypothetical protein